MRGRYMAETIHIGTANTDADTNEITVIGLNPPEGTEVKISSSKRLWKTPPRKRVIVPRKRDETANTETVSAKSNKGLLSLALVGTTAAAAFLVWQKDVLI